jgi:hypothetical protein
MKKRKILAIPPREAHYSGKRMRAEERRLKEHHEAEAKRIAEANEATKEVVI